MADVACGRPGWWLHNVGFTVALSFPVYPGAWWGGSLIIRSMSGGLVVARVWRHVQEGEGA